LTAAKLQEVCGLLSTFILVFGYPLAAGYPRLSAMQPTLSSLLMF
jgi:hypothetical protein